MEKREIQAMLGTRQDLSSEETLWERFADWVRTELVWYAGSFSFHLLALSMLLLLPAVAGRDADEGIVLESRNNEQQPITDPVETNPINRDILDDPEPANLKIDPTLKPLDLGTPSQVRLADDIRDPGDRPKDWKTIEAGSPAANIGPGVGFTGDADIMNKAGIRSGTSTVPDNGASRIGPRNPRAGVPDGSRRQQRAVTAALIWLAKHQDYDGFWSLADFARQCKPGDKTCTGRSEILADSGATAMGLLPFLAAGQTHKSPGPYQENIRKGIAWLIRHQQPDGNLAQGAQQMMYSHGLATIALAEAYGMTGDGNVGRAAQGAVNFILNAQNADGGWRYNPKDPGDTSVVGWQLMALKSAHMAGLDVGGSVYSGTSKWLDSVSVHDGTEYAYQPGQAPAPAMTSVGLLCRQYLGAKRDNPMLTGGMNYLLNHLPDEGFPNIYYWYYATQVMHNMYGTEWDTWNHKMRRILVDTQERKSDECANGSWAPEKDVWGRRGGRLMQTSLSCLTLEVYYRYLPLFKTEMGGVAPKPAGNGSAIR
jgi:hypothetical protein